MPSTEKKKSALSGYSEREGNWCRKELTGLCQTYQVKIIYRTIQNFSLALNFIK
jgi:hypothetical protein